MRSPLAAKKFTAANTRRLVQGLTLIFWLASFMWIGVSTLGKLPVKIDPLLTGARALADRSLPTGWAWMLFLPLTALILGRAWCGWVCPVGDGARPVSAADDKKNRPNCPIEFGGESITFYSLLCSWLRSAT